MSKIIVLSLFDGMSCGQIALDQLGIKYNKYYASEIDKYAIQVTQHNYPGTIQIGDIRNIKVKRINKRKIILYTDNGIFTINPKKLLIQGGSPCTNLSFAGNRAGLSTSCNIEITSLRRYIRLKKEGFEFKGQSYLFWEYMRLLKEINPRYWFLENVKMQKKWENVFNNTLGSKPIVIDSALVSAQRRVRLYWSNIDLSILEKPDDKNIYIKDIIEDKVDEKYYLSKKSVRKYKYRNRNIENVKENCIVDANNKISNKAGTLLATYNKRKKIGNFGSEPFYLEIAKPIRLGNIGTNAQAHRVYSDEGKSICISTASGGQGSATGLYYIKKRIRKLTPLECERLQTVKDNYTSIVSDTQRYKMLGNGWNIETIKHIYKYIFNKKV